MAKLTMRDLKFIRESVLYNWQAQQWTRRNGASVWYWQGDVLFPVKIGKTMGKLVSLGLMEYIAVGIPCYRATQKAHDLKCRNCHEGQLFDHNDNEIGQCKLCNGLGLTVKSADGEGE